MKIISKFHDYYDTVSVHGVSDVYYQRAESKIPYSGHLNELLYRMRYWHNTEFFSPCFVLFCGKVHAMIRIKPGVHHVYPTPEPFYLTCFEDWERYESKRKNEMVDGKYPIWNDWPKGRWYSEDFIKVTKAGWGEILSNAATFDCTELLRSVKAPVALLESNYRGDTYQLTINPQLKAFGFQKMKGPFEAYQEIDSFISGVLGTSGPQPIETSNINRLEAKGFDRITSFRKMKR